LQDGNEMNDVIRRSRADRLKKGSGLWADLILVGHALLDGRKIALNNAGTDRAHGSGMPAPLVAR
jgi:hypothetical protein